MANVPATTQDPAQNIEADVSTSTGWSLTADVTNTCLSPSMHPTPVWEMKCKCLYAMRVGSAPGKLINLINRSRYTASLTSSIERYPIENGRRYHAFKDGNYFMPNDESELDRLDLSHQMFKIAMGDKLYMAPVGKPATMLDIGTGTGIWAIEMGDDFPDSEIIGTDLSPTQPTW